MDSSVAQPEVRRLHLPAAIKSVELAKRPRRVQLQSEIHFVSARCGRWQYFCRFSTGLSVERANRYRARRDGRPGVMDALLHARRLARFDQTDSESRRSLRDQWSDGGNRQSLLKSGAGPVR